MKKGERKERKHLNMGLDGLNLGKSCYADYLKIHRRRTKRLMEQQLNKARLARLRRIKKGIDIHIPGNKSNPSL